MLTLNISYPLDQFCLDVDLTLPSQGVTAIFGRSGAGKSSLINLIAGLATPNSGKICLNGRTLFDRQAKVNLAPEKRRIGYVFQEPRLFPHYTVEKNLHYGRKYRLTEKNKRTDFLSFSQMVDLLDIAPLLSRFPDSLSGGEKQRVAIGRALLSAPEMLLMDEPLSALDLPRKRELLSYLSTLAQQVAIPILYVSHSLDEIIQLADYLLLLERGKVSAFDRTANVLQSEAFRAWQPRGEKITLLTLPPRHFSDEYQQLGLALGQQTIWLDCLSPPQTISSRLCLHSHEISLSLEKPHQTSSRNVLFGMVEYVYVQERYMDVVVNVEGERIWVTLNRWAAVALNLHTQQAVYLQLPTLSL